MYRPCGVPNIKFPFKEIVNFELEDVSTSIGDSETELFNYSGTRYYYASVLQRLILVKFFYHKCIDVARIKW